MYNNTHIHVRHRRGVRTYYDILQICSYVYMICFTIVDYTITYYRYGHSQFASQDAAS